MRKEDAEKAVREERKAIARVVHNVWRDVKKGIRTNNAVFSLALILKKIYERDGMTSKQAWARVRRYHSK